jgi:hypothetical protein
VAEDEDFRAGQIVGAQPDGAAIDCPFLPGDDGYRRRSWLGGVASVRPNIVTLKCEPLPSDDQPTHIA